MNLSLETRSYLASTAWAGLVSCCYGIKSTSNISRDSGQLRVARSGRIWMTSLQVIETDSTWRSLHKFLMAWWE